MNGIILREVVKYGGAITKAQPGRGLCLLQCMSSGMPYLEQLLKVGFFKMEQEILDLNW